jgi:DNA-binding NtrC family response regulator
MVPARETVLVVDDDAAIAKVVRALIGRRGLETAWAASGEDAVKQLEARPFDAVLSDVRMPGMDGIALLDHVKAHYPELPIVLMTAHGSVALAVEAMKRGAADFVQKPFDEEELGFVIEKALRASRQARAATPAIVLHDRGLIGDSPAIREVLATVRKVAASTTTVLVRGETGTGKELVARALHDQSPRSGQAFVTVHCGALPESLLESELFGYEKGAFTGATQRKPGRIELAHRGTLFLDEIGDVSLSMQVKLLRVLQERELERVGGTETVRVDVRIVAATHRDLEAMVREGAFREDLFYRLAVVPILVPPLRDRAGDAARLVRHFVSLLGESTGRRGMGIDDSAVALLAAEPWPGNVRQLQNFVERLVVLADGDVISDEDVERELRRGAGGRGRPEQRKASTPPSSSTAPSLSVQGDPDPGHSLESTRRTTEKEAVLRALRQAGNNRTRAARILEVSRRTLYNKLREHGID